ncbi:MAG: MarR family transcriptional regulator [Lachnospiraceae bacterium]|nr:MarR family transcriptional regulator [Lachnospiraceae bacterium]
MMNQQYHRKKSFEDAPLPFQIKMLDEKMTAIWNAELSAYGLTFSQFPVLIYLVKNQDHKVTQKELCEAVHVKHPTMIGLLDRLEEKGLVVRRRDEENHRFNRIALSERGLEMMQSFRLDRIRSDQQTVEGLSEAEMQELSRMLALLYQNVKRIETSLTAADADARPAAGAPPGDPGGNEQGRSSGS